MTEDPQAAAAQIRAELEECEDQVDQLTRENRLLRDASRTFGALAERLNKTLESERRIGGDRRTLPRANDDRRQTSAAHPNRR